MRRPLEGSQAGALRVAVHGEGPNDYGQCDAKDVLNGLFEAHGRSRPDTAMKARLAASARPSVLQDQCPVSYPPFQEYVDLLES